MVMVMHPNLLMLESGNSMIEIILFNVLGLRIQGIHMIHCYFADLQNTGLVEPCPTAEVSERKWNPSLGLCLETRLIRYSARVHGTFVGGHLACPPQNWIVGMAGHGWTSLELA